MREIQATTTDASLTALRTLSDMELVEQIRRGEQRAFEPVMRRYNRRMFRAARGIVAIDAEAEDVVQEAYVRAFLHLDEFRGPDGLGAWLTRIAVNEALQRKRRGRRADGARVYGSNPVELREETMVDENRATRTPEEEAANDQLGRLLERGIDRLPDNYRVAFILREVEQLSVAETAASLGIAQATVKTRVHRARRLLRQKLSNDIAAATAHAYSFDGHRCDRTVESVFHRLAGFAADEIHGGRAH